MFSKLVKKFLGVFTSETKTGVSSSTVHHGKRVKNATSPIEFKSKNIVMPNDKAEKEIQALYSEIRELQAQNRELANKRQLITL